MKRLIERIVCIALVVSFVLPNVAIPKVKAANVFSPIGTVTILVEKDPFPSGAFSSDVPEIEEQLEKEAVSIFRLMRVNGLSSDIMIIYHG